MTSSRRHPLVSPTVSQVLASLSPGCERDDDCRGAVGNLPDNSSNPRRALSMVNLQIKVSLHLYYRGNRSRCNTILSLWLNLPYPQPPRTLRLRHSIYDFLINTYIFLIYIFYLLFLVRDVLKQVLSKNYTYCIVHH